MKKHSVKKLRLHTETLLHLNPGDVTRVRGGIPYTSEPEDHSTTYQYPTLAVDCVRSVDSCP